MAIGRGQRDLIIGSVIEFTGIVMLAFRFGADRGGMPALVLGGILVAIGLGLQIRAVARRLEPALNPMRRALPEQAAERAPPNEELKPTATPSSLVEQFILSAAA